jgi:hypothetical protein
MKKNINIGEKTRRLYCRIDDVINEKISGSIINRKEMLLLDFWLDRDGVIRDIRKKCRNETGIR